VDASSDDMVDGDRASLMVDASSDGMICGVLVIVALTNV